MEKRLVNIDPIWGALSIAVIVCVVIAVINLVSGNTLNWQLFKKIAITLFLIGSIFELVGRLAKKK
jgi:hypothetical protein